MISPGKRKQGRPKLTLRNFFDGDFKEMELTWGTAEREFHEEKGRAVLSSLDRIKQRRCDT